MGDSEPQSSGYTFNFSDFLRKEYHFGLDPNRPTCKAYMQGHCPLGNNCPDKHNVSSHFNKCVHSR
jgi:cleavage and polyadenylation specificity factor subunit 4